MDILVLELNIGFFELVWTVEFNKVIFFQIQVVLSCNDGDKFGEVFPDEKSTKP